MESQQGQGSCFYFTLKAPAVKTEELANAVGSPRLGVSARIKDENAVNGTRDSQSANKPRLRILVGEDNTVNQMVVVGLLEQQGHTARIAATGNEVLAAWEREAFDLILMDVQMPEMDGLEAPLAIREKEKTSGGHIPIIALTAHAMSGNRERCSSAGMDGFTPKPIRGKDLVDEIERVRLNCATRSPMCTGNLTVASNADHRFA